MIKNIFRDHHDKWVAINLSTRFSTRIVTIGLLVHYLSSSEVASWYLFVAIFGLMTLVEAGLGRVITRHVSTRFKAKVSGVSKRSDSLYLQTILKLYRVVLIVLVLIAFFVGKWWFAVHGQINEVPWILTAWLLFVLANGASLYSALYAAILNGLGEVSVTQVNETISSWVNLFIFIAIALFATNLLVPSIALFTSTSVAFFLNRRSLLLLTPSLNDINWHFNFNYVRFLLARIFPDLGKYFFLMLSWHLLTSMFVLMLSHYKNDNLVASYGITMQLVTMVIAFSNIWLTASFPKMAAEKTSIDKRALKILFMAVFVRGGMLLLLGMLSILLLGGGLLQLIDSQVLLLPTEVLFVILIVIAVEYFLFTLFGQLLVSQSLMNFTKFSVIGSFLISLLALLLLYNGYGIVEMFIGRFLLFCIVIAYPILRDTKLLFNNKLTNLSK